MIDRWNPDLSAYSASTFTHTSTVHRRTIRIVDIAALITPTPRHQSRPLPQEQSRPRGALVSMHTPQLDESVRSRRHSGQFSLQ